MRFSNRLLLLLCASALFGVFCFIAPRIEAALVPGSKNLGAIWYIGDSITQGNADGDSTETVRSTLYDKLVAAGYTFTYTGHFTANSEGLPITGSDPASNLYQYHSGVSGAVIGTNYTTRTGITQNIPIWWTNTSGRLPVVQPNLILIMIGSNDAGLPLDISNAPARLSQLISTIYAQPGVGNPTILVATIPPDQQSSSSPTNVAIFNAGVPAVVQSFQSLGDDVYIVDQFSILNANFATAMTSGGLHPNAVGNDYMAQNWLNTIQGAVGVTAPVAPYGLGATATNALVTLAWNVVPGATNGYNVKRSLVSGGSYTSLATNLTATSYTDTNVVNLTKYYYVVTAVNSVGESTNSSEVAATPAVLPPPTVVTATVSGTQAVLNWPAVSNATGYKVKRSTVSGGSYTVLATNLTTTYTDNLPSNNKTYYYVVSAFNASGESANSPEVSVLTALATSFYIGDDAAEGKSVTTANKVGDTLATVTYEFVQSGTIYTNTTGSAQTLQLTEVNFFAGTNTGSITPFVSTYSGGQTATDVANAANYSVLITGSPIPVTAAGVQNQQFLVGGVNPSITLNPGAVLTAGFLSSGKLVVRINSTTSGLIDYVYNGNSVPTTLPNPLTAASTYSFDRLVKFNVGVAIPPAATVTTVSSSANPSTNGSPVTFTATVSPVPADGETITFNDSTNALGTGLMTNGLATFTTGILSAGSHSITAVYGGDASYSSSTSTSMTQNVIMSTLELAASQTNGQLQLSWLANNIGSRLQIQTNAPNVGLGTNWTDVPNSALTNQVTIPIDANNGSVFFRLVP
jgi:fibronectin type 3 domain-containing protein